MCSAKPEIISSTWNNRGYSKLWSLLVLLTFKINSILFFYLVSGRTEANLLYIQYFATYNEIYSRLWISNKFQSWSSASSVYNGTRYAATEGDANTHYEFYSILLRYNKVKNGFCGPSTSRGASHFLEWQIKMQNEATWLNFRWVNSIFGTIQRCLIHHSIQNDIRATAYVWLTVVMQTLPILVFIDRWTKHECTN